MKEYPFTVPGYESVSFTLQPGDMLQGVKVFCDGKPLKQSWGKFQGTLPSGEEIVLRLNYSIDIFTPRIKFKGKIIDVIPSRPTSEKILIYFPLILVTCGGALGGLCGGLGAYANFLIFKGKLPLPAKKFLTILTAVITIAVFTVLAAWVKQKLK